MEQDMEGLEDNTIKQTNSCYNKSKKKKVDIIDLLNPFILIMKKMLQ